MSLTPFDIYYHYRLYGKNIDFNKLPRLDESEYLVLVYSLDLEIDSYIDHTSKLVKLIQFRNKLVNHRLMF